jgi:hypothetical protein
MELGLVSAPSPEHAFALVTAALSSINRDWAPSPDAKDKDEMKEENSVSDAVSWPTTLTIH